MIFVRIAYFPCKSSIPLCYFLLIIATIMSAEQQIKCKFQVKGPHQESHHQE